MKKWLDKYQSKGEVKKQPKSTFNPYTNVNRIGVSENTNVYKNTFENDKEEKYNASVKFQREHKTPVISKTPDNYNTPSMVALRKHYKDVDNNKKILRSILKGADITTDLMQLGNFIPDPISQTIGGIGNIVGIGVDAFQVGMDLREGDYTNAAINTASVILPTIIQKYGYKRDMFNTTPGSYADKIANLGNRNGEYIHLTPHPQHVNNPVIVKGVNFNRGLLGALGAETIIDLKQNGGLVSKNSLNRTVTCSNCGWSWKLSDGGEDPLTCHKCGGTIKMKNGGQLDIYKDKGEVKSTFNPYANVNRVGTSDNTKVFRLNPEQVEKAKEAQAIKNEKIIKEYQQRQSYIGPDKRTKAERNKSIAARKAYDDLMEKQKVMKQQPIYQTLQNTTAGGYNPDAAYNPVIGNTAGALGYTAAAALASPVVRPAYNFMGQAMNAPMVGVPGLTGSNIVNAAFATHGLKSIMDGSVTKPWKEAYRSGNPWDYANAATENAMTAMEVASLIGPGYKGASEIGKYLTEETALKNASKYNPWRFKENPNSYYRQVFYKNKIKNPLVTKSMELNNDPKGTKAFFNANEDWVQSYTNDPAAPITYYNYMRFPTNESLPFFNKGKIYYGKSVKPSLEPELLLESKIPFKDYEDFYPAQQHMMFINPEEADIANKIVENRRVLSPFSKEGHNLENYNLYQPHWLKGYKRVKSASINPRLTTLDEVTISDLINKIPLTNIEYTDKFNSNIDLLNEIIFKNNKSGVAYRIKELKPNGQLIFETPNGQIVKSPSYKKLFGVKDKVIKGGNTYWETKIVPGEWKGEVLDIPNEKYFKKIPGLNMVNTSNGIFADQIARKGTGAYKSINEYLKMLNLGRVKPGFNTQTKSSKTAWKNFIKSGRAAGYYNTPETIYGAMKKEGGAIITDRGQWDYPGQTTIIPSNEITMEGVPYPVLGVDNTGYVQMMQPQMNYTFPGQYVTEYPIMQYGGQNSDWEIIE